MTSDEYVVHRLIATIAENKKLKERTKFFETESDSLRELINLLCQYISLDPEYKCIQMQPIWPTNKDYFNIADMLGIDLNASEDDSEVEKAC